MTCDTRRKGRRRMFPWNELQKFALYCLFLLSTCRPDFQSSSKLGIITIGAANANSFITKYVRNDPPSTTTTTAKGKKNQQPSLFVPQASMTLPMHYEGGSHHIYVWVGSPYPQRQTLILDTGSRYMAFPCTPCKDCGHHASPEYWNDTLSTTHRDNNHPNCVFAKNKKKDAEDDSCIFDQTYLEGSSWRAKEVEDVIFLATADQEERIEEYMPHLAIPFVFGCQYSVTGYFVSQVRSLATALFCSDLFLMFCVVCMCVISIFVRTRSPRIRQIQFHVFQLTSWSLFRNEMLHSNGTVFGWYFGNGKTARRELTLADIETVWGHRSGSLCHVPVADGWITVVRW